MIYRLRGTTISRNIILYPSVFSWQSRAIVLVSATIISSDVWQLLGAKYKKKDSYSELRQWPNPNNVHWKDY